MIAGGVIALLALIFSRPWEKAAPLPVEPSAQRSAPTTAAPSEARQLVAKAWVLLNKPEMARAELDAADALCKRAAALDATDAEVWAAWAHVNVWYCFHNLDRSAPRQEAAREYASRAMQLDPKSYEARLAQAFYWARGEANSRRLGEAQSLLRELLRERPDEPRALFTLGYMLDYPAETEAEGAALLERLARNPGFAAVAWDEIGWAAYFKGDWVKAEAAIARSLAAQPYWNNLGLKITMAERVHGDMDLAESALKQMPASARQEDWGIGFACEVYQWRREPLRTIEVLEGVSRDWIHYFFYDYPKAYLLGEARMMAKQTGAARRDFQRARVLIEKQLADDPNNGPLLGLQARTLLYLGEKEEAEKSYRLVKELGGTDYLQIWFAPPEAAIAFIRSMADAPRGDVIGRTFFSAASLRLDPQFDRLRPEPAFEALLTELEARNQPAAPSPSPLSRSPSTPPDAKSVAVLAFANLSDDKGNEYFSDGITEELLNVLAKVPGLKVTARTSSFYFKGKEVTVPEIARQLGVAYVVEGSVRKAGDKVRITAQLIKAADGFEVWSDQFDRELKDVFAVQDEIAGLIAKNLQLKMGAAARVARTVDPEAHRLVLEGRYFWNLRTDEGFARAETAFVKAIEIDPKYAEAHSGLAGVCVIREQYRVMDGYDANPADAGRARAEAQRAIELEPTLAEPHAVLGYGLMFENRLAESEQEFQRALALNPNDPVVRCWHANNLAALGRIDQSLPEYEKAAELDPLWFINYQVYLRGLVSAQRYGDALKTATRAAALRAEADIFIPSLGHVAQALLALGRKDEAVETARRVRRNGELRPRWDADPNAIFVLRKAGFEREAEDYAKEVFARLPSGSYMRGWILVALGRFDEALPFLGQPHPGLLHGIYWGTMWDPWREDPRFGQMLAKYGCTEEYKVARTTLARMLKERATKK